MTDYDPEHDALIENLVTRVKMMFHGGKIDPGEAQALLAELQRLAPEQLVTTIDRVRAEYPVSPGADASPANAGRDCGWCSHYEEANDPDQFRCLFDDKLYLIANATRAQRCVHWLYPFGDIEP